jgi:CubicO group peptidase (beta-lactamase class C family)
MADGLVHPGEPAATVQTGPVTDIDRSPLDQTVAEYATEHLCPTVSWGVVRDGALQLSGAAAADARHIDEHSVYRIASMTKSFSAAATLLLRDEGLLRLDDPVSEYDTTLDGLRSRTSDAPPITVRDLLAMTSGLVTDDPWADRHLDLTDEEFDQIVAEGCVFAEPTGTAYEYSNFGFAVLGRVVERAAGRRIQQVISDRLLTPLGMSCSTWLPPVHDRWLRPMRWLDDRWEEEIPTPGDGLIAPMGGIWSTVADLARWVAWLDDAFPARDGADDGPLSRASRREMQTVQRYVGWRTLRGVRSPSGYGYGLRIQFEDELGTMVTHSGGFPGYGSTMRWLPGRRLGVIALSNVTYAPMTELACHLLDRLHEQGVVPPMPRRVTAAVSDAADGLVALLNDWTDTAADALFTDNVAWDDSYGRRRSAVAGLLPLTLDRVAPINDARAKAVCTAADGARVTITFVLGTALPARIQDYDVTVS